MKLLLVIAALFCLYAYSAYNPGYGKWELTVGSEDSVRRLKAKDTPAAQQALAVIMARKKEYGEDWVGSVFIPAPGLISDLFSTRTYHPVRLRGGKYEYLAESNWLEVPPPVVANRRAE